MPSSALGVFGLKACVITPEYNQKIERESFWKQQEKSGSSSSKNQNIPNDRKGWLTLNFFFKKCLGDSRSWSAHSKWCLERLQ